MSKELQERAELIMQELREALIPIRIELNMYRKSGANNKRQI